MTKSTIIIAVLIRCMSDQIYRAGSSSSMDKKAHNIITSQIFPPETSKANAHSKNCNVNIDAATAFEKQKKLIEVVRDVDSIERVAAQFFLDVERVMYGGTLYLNDAYLDGRNILQSEWQLHFDTTTYSSANEDAIFDVQNSSKELGTAFSSSNPPGVIISTDFNKNIIPPALSAVSSSPDSVFFEKILEQNSALINAITGVGQNHLRVVVPANNLHQADDILVSRGISKDGASEEVATTGISPTLEKSENIKCSLCEQVQVAHKVNTRRFNNLEKDESVMSSSVINIPPTPIDNYMENFNFLPKNHINVEQLLPSPVESRTSEIRRMLEAQEDSYNTISRTNMAGGGNIKNRIMLNGIYSAEVDEQNEFFKNRNLVLKRREQLLTNCQTSNDANNNSNIIDIPPSCTSTLAYSQLSLPNVMHEMSVTVLSKCIGAVRKRFLVAAFYCLRRNVTECKSIFNVVGSAQDNSLCTDERLQFLKNSAAQSVILNNIIQQHPGGGAKPINQDAHSTWVDDIIIRRLNNIIEAWSV